MMTNVSQQEYDIKKCENPSENHRINSTIQKPNQFENIQYKFRCECKRQVFYFRIEQNQKK